MNKLFISIALMAMTIVSVNAQFAPTTTAIKPLLVGQAVPDIALVDGNGASKTFHNVIGDKPTLVMFYRGDWCFNCINHFNAEVVPNLTRIDALGYNVMFIGPDMPDSIRTTAGKINVPPAMIYSDAAVELSVAMDIAWQQQERMLPMLATYSGGKNKGFVPAVSTFVISADKIILFEDIRPNAIPTAARIKGNLLMAVLENLK